MLDKLAEKHTLWLKMVVGFGYDVNRIMYNDDEVNRFFIYVTLKNMYYTYEKAKSKFVWYEIRENDAIDYELRDIATGSGISLTSIFNSMRTNKQILKEKFAEDWEDFKNGDYNLI